MKRILKQATIVELENNPAELSKALTERAIDALGANRQRLTTLSTATPGTRLLPDDLFNVPQIGLPAERDRARRRHWGCGRAGRRESRMSRISGQRTFSRPPSLRGYETKLNSKMDLPDHSKGGQPKVS